MGTSEKFCLRWNDFENNISLAFREIREEKDFFDCTISCGSKQIQAHKLILSACSPFFRLILKQNPHQHPLLYLKGVQYSDLTAVLNFMYHGEVNVAQDELNSFLAVAEDLQVKGLTQNNDSNSATSKPKLESSVLQPSSSQSYSRQRPSKDLEVPPPKRPRQVPHQPIVQSNNQQQQIDDDEIQEVLPTVKTEPESSNIYTAPIVEEGPLHSQSLSQHGMDNIGLQVSNVEDTFPDDSYDYTGYGESHSYDTSLIGLEGQGMLDQSKDVVDTYAERIESGKYSCKICMFTARDKYNIRLHIERKHELSSGYRCPYCYKNVKTKQDLSQHKSVCEWK